ncbi:MAG: ATP-dependent zinc metalloprotease FtsH [Actinomycetaceae bacterium]|nr:ATP-dependent zinc metalloprotease FtsH [Actinomycetaceae bacterium]
MTQETAHTEAEGEVAATRAPTVVESPGAVGTDQPAGSKPEAADPESEAGRAVEHGGGGKQGKNDKAKRRRLRLRLITVAVVAAVVAVVVALWATSDARRFKSVTTSEGIALLETANITRAEITDGTQQVRLWLTEPTKTVDEKGTSHSVGTRVTFQYVEAQADQIAELVAAAKPTRGYNSVVPVDSIWSSIVIMAVPLLIIVAFFVFITSQMQSGLGGLGNLRDRRTPEGDRPNVTFDDVAGEDEAVAELQEITEFLAAPERFHALGAKIPRGVLLYGPPGTGKTLLARAVAGEAGVPFFTISASEFVEMFVGVGASRVRSLFNKAKEQAPAIVFVDEIDAVGRGRGVGIGGGNDEREQTLNQLLVELDGFDERANVILIAATNRPDVLDPALLRPGRFDRQIAVDSPDLNGRSAILAVHARGKPLEADIDLAAVARRTPGFTGADLENILNEAALLAARNSHERITEDDVDEAIDRVLAGPQRSSRVMNAEEKRMTAYHEAGHALAAAALHHTDPVTKVTILPRGRALGYTMVMPQEDRYSHSRSQLLDEITYALGGRAAEEIIFGDPSTGAANDIQKATSVARRMVTEYGMTSSIGPVRTVTSEVDPLTAGAGEGQPILSDALAGQIDVEVRRLIDDAHVEARSIITQNRDVLDTLAQRLLEKETVLEAELTEIFAAVRMAPQRRKWESSSVEQVGAAGAESEVRDD